MTTVTRNKSQGLYVINHDTFVTCLGFDVAFNKLKALHNELSPMVAKPLRPLAKYKGTMKVYNDLQKLIDVAKKLNMKHGISFRSELTKELIGLEGNRVEVVDAHGEKRCFKVGRSTGWMPCHLELANSRSRGGYGVIGTPFKSVRVIS